MTDNIEIDLQITVREQKRCILPATHYTQSEGGKRNFCNT